jgi:hypothetical protein
MHPLQTIVWPEGYRVRALDHLQWVMERRDKKGRDGRLEPIGEVWRPVAYCRTRIGLETALSRLRCEKSVHLDSSLIAHLPEFYPDKAEPIEHVSD